MAVAAVRGAEVDTTRLMAGEFHWVRASDNDIFDQASADVEAWLGFSVLGDNYMETIAKERARIFRRARY